MILINWLREMDEMEEIRMTQSSAIIMDLGNWHRGQGDILILK